MVYNGTDERRTLSQQRTVTPGETVGSSVTITNEEETSQTVLVTLSVEEEPGVTPMDGPATTRAITLEAGESRGVEPSWTVTEAIPDGTYDLVTEVWLETDPGALTTQLGSRRTEDAFTLQKPRGELAVTASPEDAVVTLDGEIIGETPLDTEIAVGTYDVAVINDAYEPVSRQVSVETGETATVSVTLDRIDAGSGTTSPPGGGSSRTTNRDGGGNGQTETSGPSPTETSGEGPPATDGTASATDTEPAPDVAVGEDGAGFGVASAVASLGGLSYLLKRRRNDDQQEETKQR